MADQNDDFWDLYQRPEWQERRLRIMDLYGFKCEECGDGSSTLHVHHGYYIRGRKPWEYPDECFSCLCDPCHDKRHALSEVLKKTVARFNLADQWRMIGYARGVWFLKQPPSDHAHDLSIGDPAGIADTLRLTIEDVFTIAGRKENGSGLTVADHGSTNAYYAILNRRRGG